MTSMIKAAMITAMVIILAVFLIGAVYNNEQLDSADSRLQEYYARKEELAAEQQKLASLVVSLNQTLSQEIAREQALSAQLSSPTQANSAPAGAASLPEPAPQPAPKVTRAS